MSVPALSLFGLAIAGERLWYWVVAVSLVGAVALALNLIESPMGRALRALNGSEVGARVSGIDATRAKVGVFVLSAVFASVAAEQGKSAENVSPATAVQRENALRDLVRAAADEIATPIVQRTGGSLDPAGLDGIVAEITSAVYGEMARW